MSARYEELLADWRAAAAAAKAAQNELQRGFDAFLEGRGAEPLQQEVERVQKLRQAEGSKLTAAVTYLREMSKSSGGQEHQGANGTALGRSGHGSESVMAHLPSRVAAGASARRAARGRHTILVVDDLPASRYPTVRSMQHAGFQTLSAETGSEALASADGVAAVILDVNLPDLNGVAVCSMLKDKHKDLPVILTSAYYGDNVHRQAGLQAGAAAYMVTPLDYVELVDVLDRLLRIG